MIISDVEHLFTCFCWFLPICLLIFSIYYLCALTLMKALENPLDFKEIQLVHPKGDQSWDFFGRTDAEAETPILWPPHAKSWLIGKDSDAGRDWGQEKGTTEDEMAEWHHGLHGRESEWTPGDGDGQGGLVCCGSWDRKELDTTERLNWTELWTRKLQTLFSYWKAKIFSGNYTTKIIFFNKTTWKP